MNADDLLQQYSRLDRRQQRRFDRRYKELMAFRTEINRIVKLPKAEIERLVRAARGTKARAL